MSPLDKVMLTLHGRLRSLADRMGWDNAAASRQPRDPAGKIRLSYLSHQGSFLVHVDDATAYLEWLEAGNMGTIMKWARERGRRLK